ncbi:hypothetical protein MRB53_033108 [Persea americana]|uniref:Uncharacterized protein n=1 Tax=Persea americana TaxID=3435 RepID=A0ACC2KUD0_PERAE|nr:hypothetical protein MRB53_033108 [Persea americana]
MPREKCSHQQHCAKSALDRWIEKLIQRCRRSIFKGSKAGKNRPFPSSRSSLSRKQSLPFSALSSLSSFISSSTLYRLSHGWLPSHSPSSYLEGYVTHDNVAEQQKPDPTRQGYAMLFLKVTSGCSPKIRALD